MKQEDASGTRAASGSFQAFRSLGLKAAMSPVDRKNVADASRAVQLAHEMEIPSLLYESLIVQGYIRSLKALWEIKQIVTLEGVTNKEAAQRFFKDYIDGLRQAQKYLPIWEKTLPIEDAAAKETADGVKLIEKIIAGMKETAKTFDIVLE